MHPCAKTGPEASETAPARASGAVGVTTRHAEPATERTRVLTCYEERRYGMFVHFTINSFVDKPFCCALKGPLPSPQMYRPTALDVEQWILVAKRAGMKYAVLTAKHYLGFALWPSECTDYGVSASPNPTDVVAEFMAACHKHGVAPGLYYSLGVDIAHRRDQGMNDAQWYDHACTQIAELLTRYGPVSLFWFDAVGQVAPGRLQEAYDTVKSLQPDCVVVVNHGHGSNGTRLRFWPTDVIGAERTLPPPEGHDPWMEHEGKTYYIPMEICETSTRGTFSKGWFWEPGEQMKEVGRELLRLYRNATERGANLLLNVSIHPEGKVPDVTAERLTQLRQAFAKLPQ